MKILQPGDPFKLPRKPTFIYNCINCGAELECTLEDHILLLGKESKLQRVANIQCAYCEQYFSVLDPHSPGYDNAV